MVANLVTGVTEGFKKELEISGVGYRAQMQGNDAEAEPGPQPRRELRSAGGRHRDLPRSRPKSWSRASMSNSSVRSQPISATGASPEPYKGKGIKYKDEYIFRKEGKKK